MLGHIPGRKEESSVQIRKINVQACNFCLPCLRPWIYIFQDTRLCSKILLTTEKCQFKCDSFKNESNSSCAGAGWGGGWGWIFWVLTAPALVRLDRPLLTFTPSLMLLSGLRKLKQIPKYMANTPRPLKRNKRKLRSVQAQLHFSCLPVLQTRACEHLLIGIFHTVISIVPMSGCLHSGITSLPLLEWNHWCDPRGLGRSQPFF